MDSSLSLNAPDCVNTINQSKPQNTLSNHFVYLNQNHHKLQGSHASQVLINPHFKSKVYINPNFNSSVKIPPVVKKIHINPCAQTSLYVQKVDVQDARIPSQDRKLVNSIHVNPNFPKIFVNPKMKTVVSSSTHLPTHVTSISTSGGSGCTKKAHTIKNVLLEVEARGEVLDNKPVVLTRTKLIRETKRIPWKKKRRSSLHSKYKIIKSTSFKTLKQSTQDNRFKVDNRQTAEKPFNKKKYIFINKFLSMSELLARKVLLKSSEKKPSGFRNSNGVLVKRSANSIRRTSVSSITTKKILDNTIKSKYRLVRKPVKQMTERKMFKKKDNRTNSTIKRFKIIRSEKVIKGKTKMPPKLMKKCNIPCPYYKKLGKCKGRENGLCQRKHDPDQISLCTKFLQGACINENCLLSHKVSPEKMPTCKYYLEGSCSRENCPYVHVKLSAKTDICRDFIEGFCKAGTECIKRHQYLCPDYDKYGKCGKQRCTYPHGKMVRKYLLNKQKFTKKCSENELKAGNNKQFEKNDNKHEQIDRARYYLDRPGNNSDSDKSNTYGIEKLDQNCDINVEFSSRPKLGRLPSFIGFDER